MTSPRDRTPPKSAPISGDQENGASRSISGSYPSGERRLITALVADLKDSTELAEQMELEAWVEAMDQILRLLASQVMRYGGTIDQFRGDGLIAFFGIPAAYEDHAERAVLAALAMQEALHEEPSLLERLDLKVSAGELLLRVGVSTGDVVVGAVGEPGHHVERTAMGRTLALASRLEAAAEPGTVLVTEDTYRLARARFTWRPMGARRVDGVREALRVYRPLGLAPEATAEHDVGGLRAPLVGRAGALQLLNAAVARVRSGSGGIVTLVGDAGIGKSRLVAEARSRTGNPRPAQSTAEVPAERRGPSSGGTAASESAVSVRWVEGRWLSYTGDVAYRGWQELLRQLLRLPDECDRTACAALEVQIAELCRERARSAYPYLARLLALPLDPAASAQLDSLLDAGLLQDAMFRAIADLLACAARRVPFVLVLEDLHWADEASLALLTGLLRLTEQHPILVVALMRPARSHGCWKVRDVAMSDFTDSHTDIWLTPLSTDETRTLACHLLSGRECDEIAGVVDTIVKRAEGNPFFAAEIVRSLSDQGLAADGLPPTVQGVLMARIDRLPAAARHVLQVGAVIGRVFSYSLLADVLVEQGGGDATGLERGELDVALGRLLRAGLIRERARRADWRTGETLARGRQETLKLGFEREFIFDHQLTLEAAYGSLLHRQRRELHRRVARALERLYPEQVAGQLGLLAYHWEAADDCDQAIAYLSRAGEQAAAQYANEAAIGYFTRALQLVPADNHRRRFVLLMARERVHDRQGAYEAQAEDLALLRQAAKAMGDVRAQSAVPVRQAAWARLRGERQSVTQQAEWVIASARSTGGRVNEAVAHLILGWLLLDESEMIRALVHCEEALRLAREADRPELEVESLRCAGSIAMWLDDRDRAGGLLNDALALSRELGDRAGGDD